MNYYNLYKISDSPYYRQEIRSLPQAKDKKERVELFNYIKGLKNATIKVYHGTSESIWNAVQKRGYFTSPVMRNAQDKEQRDKGLDLVFVTTSLGYAMRYGFGTAEQTNSNPIVLELEIPLYYFVEVSNIILGADLENIYNQEGVHLDTAKILRSDLSKQNKAQELMKLVKSYVETQQRNEFTVKYNLSTKFVKSTLDLRDPKTEDTQQNATENNKQNLWNDRKLISMALKYEPARMLSYAPEHIKNNSDIILEAMQYDSDAFDYISDVLLNNYKFLAKALAIDGLKLEVVPSSVVKTHPDLVLIASKQNPHALYFAPKDAHKDANFMLQVGTQNEAAFQYIHRALQDDETFMLQAASIGSGQALVQASERLQYKRDFILKVVERNGRALYYTKFKDDAQVALQATKQNAEAFAFVSENLKQDENFVLDCVRGNPNIFAKTNLRNNKRLALEVLKLDASIFSKLPQEVQNDRNFVLAAIRQNGLILSQLAETNYVDDHQIVFDAVKQNVKALAYASSRLKNDANFVNQIYNINTNPNFHATIDKILSYSRLYSAASTWYRRSKF